MTQLRGSLLVFATVLLGLAACTGPTAGEDPEVEQRVLALLQNTIERDCPLNLPKLELINTDGDYQLWRSSPTREDAERLIVSDTITGCEIVVQNALYEQSDGTFVPESIRLQSYDNLTDAGPVTSITGDEAFQNKLWIPRFVSSGDLEQSLGTPMLRNCLQGREEQDAYASCQFEVADWFQRRATMLMYLRPLSPDFNDQLVDIVDGHAYSRNILLE